MNLVRMRRLLAPTTKLSHQATQCYAMLRTNNSVRCPVQTCKALHVLETMLVGLVQLRHQKANEEDADKDAEGIDKKLG